MEKETEELRGKNKDIIRNAFVVFIGKTIGGAIVGFFRAFLGGLILAYPLKWFWNALSLELTKLGILHISYWTAFKLLLIIGILFRRQIIVKEVLTDGEKVEINE